MIDKPRGKKGGGDKGPRSSGKALGGAAGGRPNRPVTQPRTRYIEGVREDALETLHEQGLLSTEGEQLRSRVRVGTDLDATAKPTTGLRPRPKTERSGRPLVDGPKTTIKRPGVAGPQRFSTAESVVAQRLHKVMAHAGVASRRHSEELIQAGRVSVNGVVVKELGAKAVPGKDMIEVDGRPLGKSEDLIYIILNKPKGYVTTLFDPQGRPKVVDLIGGEVSERIYPVGRLDYETEGLLLLTNDGELANALMHPARMIKKTYIAKVRGVPGPAKIKALESGVELEDGVTAPAEVKLMEVKGPNSAILSIKIHEGRNRQVRRMLEYVGHETIHLKRLSLGPLHLQDLQVGKWRTLTETELSALRMAVDLKQRQPRTETRGRTGGAISVPARRRSDKPPSAGRVARTERPAAPDRFGRPERTAGHGKPTRPGTGVARMALGPPVKTGTSLKRGPGLKKFGTPRSRPTK